MARLLTNETPAEQRERINTQYAAMRKRQQQRALESLIADGYPKVTSLHSAHRDLANGGHSLADRIGRGFTA